MLSFLISLFTVVSNTSPGDKESSFISVLVQTAVLVQLPDGTSVLTTPGNVAPLQEQNIQPCVIKTLNSHLSVLKDQ